jgi:chromosome segregation ATPase
LQEQNEKLTEEVERFKTLAGTEVTLRQQREDMDKTLEHSAKEAKSKLRALSEEKMRLQRQVKRLTRRLNRSKREIKLALSALQRCGVEI